MSRAIKDLVLKDMESRFSGVDSALLINVHPLTGTEANLFRAELRKKKIAVHVVKNRFMKRLIGEGPLSGLATGLRGPCALVTGGDSPVDIAKELIRLVKEYPKLELRGGVTDGDPEFLTVEAISKRRSLAELQGEVVMLATSPGRRIAGCLNVGGKIAGCIKTIVDKLEKGETISKVA